MSDFPITLSEPNLESLIAQVTEPQTQFEAYLVEMEQYAEWLNNL